MPLLQVRDFPQDIYEEITFEARRQNRTIAQQTIVLIKKGLQEEISNSQRRHMAIEKTFARNVPTDAKSMDYVRLIREDRER
jgi:Holliday junction resolvasome RuvABC endonuclease subunit